MAAKQHSAHHPFRLSRRSGWLAFYALLILSGAWLATHQSVGIATAIREVRLARPPQLIGAAIVFMMSVLWAAGVYYALLPGRLRYGRTVVVQAAGLCANKLLPSGSGAIGLSYLYLRRENVATTEAAAAVTANNALGFVGNGLLMAVLLAAVPSSRAFVQVRYHLSVMLVLLVVVGLLVTAAGLVVIRRLPVVVRALRAYMRSLAMVLRGRRTLSALLCSIGITVTYVAVLGLVGRAIGVSLTFAQMVVVMTLGVAATSIVPTPGGIGAAEAGVFAALRLYGVTADSALAVALLYRLVTFWIPLVYGAVALVVAQQRRYI